MEERRDEHDTIESLVACLTWLQWTMATFSLYFNSVIHLAEDEDTSHSECSQKEDTFELKLCIRELE